MKERRRGEETKSHYCEEPVAQKPTVYISPSHKAIPQINDVSNQEAWNILDSRGGRKGPTHTSSPSPGWVPSREGKKLWKTNKGVSFGIAWAVWVAGSMSPFQKVGIPESVHGCIPIVHLRPTTTPYTLQAL